MILPGFIIPHLGTHINFFYIILTAPLLSPRKWSIVLARSRQDKSLHSDEHRRDVAAMDKEIISLAEEPPERSYETRALGHSIFTEPDTGVSFKRMAHDAVNYHVDVADKLRVVRLHLVKEEVLAVWVCSVSAPPTSTSAGRSTEALWRRRPPRHQAQDRFRTRPCVTVHRSPPLPRTSASPRWAEC